MPEAKNMHVLDVDINESNAVLIGIVQAWPTVNYVNLPDLAAPLAADIAWARRRHALGNKVNSEPPNSQKRRQLVNKALFEIFRGQSAAPQIHFDPETGAAEISRARMSDLEMFHAAVNEESPHPIGRPRMFTRDQANEMAFNADHATRRRLGRLKLKDA